MKLQGIKKKMQLGLACMATMGLGILFSSIEAKEAYAANPVEINEANFSDEGFRNWIAEAGVDTNGDNILSEDELAAVTEIENVGIVSDLKGIEYFVNLQVLECDYNNLSNLDVSQNPELGYLECGYNPFSSLDVSRNPVLTFLFCIDNSIEAPLYKDSDEYYVDMTTFPLDRTRISTPSIGSYDSVAGRIIMNSPLQPGDTLTYDYATGYGNEKMTVTIVISKVKEISTTETPTTELHGSTSDITATTEATVTTAAVGKQATPMTGDEAICCGLQY